MIHVFSDFRVLRLDLDNVDLRNNLGVVAWKFESGLDKVVTTFKRSNTNLES